MYFPQLLLMIYSSLTTFIEWNKPIFSHIISKIELHPTIKNKLQL